MGNKDNGFIFFFHFFHNAVDDVTSFLGQCRGCLIYYQHFRLLINRFRDLNQFTILHIQGINRCTRIHTLKSNGVQCFFCFCIHRFFIYNSESREFLFISKKNVLRNRNTGNGSLLLHDHSNSTGRTLNHGRRFVRLAFKKHFSAGCRLHACCNGCDGGFTGTVFTDQTGDLAAVNFKINVIQCHRRAKMFC